MRLVTLTRPAWRSLTAQAASHMREGGGLLIGQRTRYGNILVVRDVPLVHIESDDSHVAYDPNERALARATVDEAYKPHYVVGEWHSHPWPSCCAAALLPQISDDWNDKDADVCEMLDGEVELILSVFPEPSYKLNTSDTVLQRCIAKRVCRGEAWYREEWKRVKPCRIALRSGPG